MKKVWAFVLAVFAASALCVSCVHVENKTVKIAIMGNKEDFNLDYEDGILRAVEDLNREYAGTGYNVECRFYDQLSGSRETLATIEALARDKTVTAVIASKDRNMVRSAAYTLNDANKIYLSPYDQYDSVFEKNRYGTVFSLSYSDVKIGGILRDAAGFTGAQRFAVLYDENGRTSVQAKGFLHNRESDGLVIVDIEDIQTAKDSFSDVLNRWVLLDVQGVVILADEARFDLIKKIREADPDIKIIGNDSFDDFRTIESDPELVKDMTGVIMTSGIIGLDFSEDEDVERFIELKNDFYAKNNRSFDAWFLQAYNMIRMIVDTAVENDTTDSGKIAAVLHEKGYDGIAQNFYFSENGNLTNTVRQFAEVQEDCSSVIYNVNDDNGYEMLQMKPGITEPDGNGQ